MFLLSKNIFHMWLVHSEIEIGNIKIHSKINASLKYDAWMHHVPGGVCAVRGMSTTKEAS